MLSPNARLKKLEAKLAIHQKNRVIRNVITIDGKLWNEIVLCDAPIGKAVGRLLTPVKDYGDD